MIKKETIKNVTKLVAMSAASIGSGAITGAYIAAAPFTKAPSMLMKACIWFGGICIESVMANKTADEANKWVDAIFTTTETVANLQPVILNEVSNTTNEVWSPYTIKSIAFETPQDAENVLDMLCAKIDADGYCSVADYYEACSQKTIFPDHKWGWDNLTRDVKVKKAKDGYTINLPKPIRL